MSIKVVSWNINKCPDAWEELLATDADVALLQEVGVVPQWVPGRDGVGIGPREHWNSHTWLAERKLYDRWSMVVKLSDQVEVEWFKQVAPKSQTRRDEFAVSGIGAVAAARVVPRAGQSFVVVSMYGRWIRWHPSVKSSWKVGYPDGAVHRIISDLSAFIGSYDPSSHRILAAGDLNMSFRSSDPHNDRAQTVLDRMQVLGLEYMGPTFPNGRRADPVPPHLTEGSLDLPTHRKGEDPSKAEVQLDHVFASRGFHESVSASALNEVEEWGVSDHCRVLIEVSGGGPK